MIDSLALLAIRIAADMPDLAPLIVDIVRLMSRFPDSQRSRETMRLRAVLKGVDSRRLSSSEGFAALKVHVDDLLNAV